MNFAILTVNLIFLLQRGKRECDTLFNKIPRSLLEVFYFGYIMTEIR